MKPLTFVVAIGMLVAAGCSSASSEHPIQHDADPVTHVLYPLDSAQIDINRLDTLSRRYLGSATSPIRAYTIRAIDLLGALGMNPALEDSAKYKHIRVYLAYRQNKGFKLFLVPVDSAYINGKDTANWRGGYDIFLNSQGKCIPRKKGPTTSVETPYVLDLNAPCPATCAEGSPMTQ